MKIINNNGISMIFNFLISFLIFLEINYIVDNKYVLKLIIG